ncbi:C-C chemokine receptor type 5 [Astyanax mexicanus]|uniref:C-C chemokine receptor type 5 n=1 Tax=Astyanax mexicanus TaxID=7994 RepID=UPI0020CB5933|nr:C-C chemokine receptor type 5 [Astyanax mexicanus]
MWLQRLIHERTAELSSEAPARLLKLCLTMALNSTDIPLHMTLSSFSTTESSFQKGNDSASNITEIYDYSTYYDGNYDGTEPCDYGSHGSRFLPLLYSLFFLVGFFGNTLVVWVIMMGAQLKSMTDVCLLNLAVADLLLVMSLPFLAYYAANHWIFGEVWCTVVLGMYYVGFYGSIFFIVLMSIDRYLAVVLAVYALRIRTKAYGIVASLIIWTMAFSASFPELIYIKVENINNESLCTAYPNISDNHFLRTFGLFKINIVGLLIPLMIVGFCYTMVLRRLLKIRSPKRFAIRLVVLVMVVFFCCWTPYNIAAFIKGLELKHVINQHCETSKSIQLALQITEAIAYSHSCLNPFLYVFVGEKFKRHLIKLLRLTPCIKLKFMTSYLSQAVGSVYSQTTSVDERSTAM